MDVTASLIAAAKAGAGKFVGDLTPEVRLLVAQKRAAAGVEAYSFGPLAAELDTVIALLTGRAEEPGLLRERLAQVRRTIVAVDDVFRGDSMKAWLDDLDVRSALAVVAAGRLMGEAPVQAEERANRSLAAAYEHHLGERGEHARGAVEMVIAVLVAGIHTALSASPTASALAARNQAGHMLIRGAFEALRSDFTNGGFIRTPSVLLDDGTRSAPVPPSQAVDTETVLREFGAASQVLLGWPQEVDDCWIDRPELDHLHALATSDTPG